MTSLYPGPPRLVACTSEVEKGESYTGGERDQVAVATWEEEEEGKEGSSHVIQVEGPLGLYLLTIKEYVTLGHVSKPKIAIFNYHFQLYTHSLLIYIA